MPRFIAFLRAINVGGHTVKMDELRKLFEDCGFSNVETFIASGNVIFDAESESAQALEIRIESHLKESLGYEVTTFIRTPSDVADIAAYNPFPDSQLGHGETLYISFLPARPDADAQQKLHAFHTEVDEFHLQGRELYWLRRVRMSDPAYPDPPFGKALGMPSTMRNATTVQKLAAKYAPSDRDSA